MLPSNPVVLSSGSATTRAGFARDGTPRLELATVVGLRGGQAPLIGDEALSTAEPVLHRRPVEEGTLADPKAIEPLWRAVFERLAVRPEDTPVLLTLSPQSPAAATADAVCTLFDVFDVPAVAVAQDAALGLRSTTRSTGVAVCIGHHVTHIAPIIEGYALPHASVKLNLAGDDITNHLLRLLHHRGVRVQGAAACAAVQRAKERHCYIADDLHREMRTFPRRYERRFTLPCGEVVTLGTERFEASEVLFRPGLVPLGRQSIAEAILDAVHRAESSIQADLLDNIVVFGGTAAHHGLGLRLTYELQRLGRGHPVRVSVERNPATAVWRGGAVQALTGDRQQWLTRAAYRRSQAPLSMGHHR